MAYDFPTTLTHSKLLSIGCPSRYERLHVLGLSDTSDPARRGSTIHAANEIYVANLAESGMASDADFAVEALHEAIVAENTPPHLVPECEHLWQGWVERFELDLGAFLEAEKRKVVGRFSFKPDYVLVHQDELAIHDLKTHFRSINQKDANGNLQARMSAFLASKVWPGFARYTFTFHFIRLFQDVTATFEPSELDAIERQIDAHAEAITFAEQSGEYPAAPGENCAFCSFACSLVDDARRLPMRLLTPDDATRTAGEILALRQTLAAKLRALEAYAGVSGPVLVGGVEFAHRPTSKMAFPAAQVIDALRSKGADVSKIQLGKTALRAYLQSKKWSHVTPLIQPLAIITNGTKFSSKIAAESDDDADQDE